MLERKVIYDAPQEKFFEDVLKKRLADLMKSNFKELTGKEKRSLASEYLHFHVPIFPIYDSRANNSINEIVEEKINPSELIGDKEYSKFCNKVLILYNYIKAALEKNPALREIDTFLINKANKRLSVEEE